MFLFVTPVYVFLHSTWREKKHISVLFKCQWEKKVSTFYFAAQLRCLSAKAQCPEGHVARRAVLAPPSKTVCCRPLLLHWSLHFWTPEVPRFQTSSRSKVKHLQLEASQIWYWNAKVQWASADTGISCQREMDDRHLPVLEPQPQDFSSLRLQPQVSPHRHILWTIHSKGTFCQAFAKHHQRACAVACHAPAGAHEKTPRQIPWVAQLRQRIKPKRGAHFG